MIAEDKVTGQPIGTCCAVIKNGGTCWDIGYCIHPTRWRQGYAKKEMVTAVVAFGAQNGVKHFSLMLPRKISAPAPSCVFLALPHRKRHLSPGQYHTGIQKPHIQEKNYDVKQPYPYHQFHYCPALHCRRTPHPHRFGRPVRQRQNDAGGTAGRAVSRQPDHPHRRLPPPACPAGAGVGNTPCANMDLKRLRAEVLNPARAGAAVFLYRILLPGWSLSAASLPARAAGHRGGQLQPPPGPRRCYDLRVFVTCSRRNRPARLQAREGARYPAFAQRWIPLEEGYFTKYSIEESADLILDTEKGMIETTKS